MSGEQGSVVQELQRKNANLYKEAESSALHARAKVMSYARGAY